MKPSASARKVSMVTRMTSRASAGSGDASELPPSPVSPPLLSCPRARPPSRHQSRPPSAPSATRPVPIRRRRLGGRDVERPSVQRRRLSSPPQRSEALDGLLGVGRVVVVGRQLQELLEVGLRLRLLAAVHPHETAVVVAVGDLGVLLNRT